MLPQDRMGSYEMQLVEQRRTRFRASWQDCAAMLGRSVHDVRTACDPSYKPEVTFSRAERSPSTVALSGNEAQIIHALGEIYAQFAQRERPKPEATVTELVAMVELGAVTAGRTLAMLAQRSLVSTYERPSGVNNWRLTLDGRAALAARVMEAARG